MMARQGSGKPPSRREAPRQDDYVPLWARFKAWWDGTEPEALQRAGATDKPAAERNAKALHLEAGPPTDPANWWSPERVEIHGNLWGSGYLEPGGADRVLALVKPLALTNQMTVLDAIAGLGGGMRTIVREYGNWMTGLEPDARLAELGMASSGDSKLANRAPVHAYDTARMDLPDRKFDAVLMRDRGFQIKEKRRLLASIRKALKPGGYLILTDLALADTAAPNMSPVSAWLRAEVIKAEPWAVRDYRYALEETGFEIRQFEDDSDFYRNASVEGWKMFMKILQKQQGLSRTYVSTFLQEADIWQKRLKAIDAGQVRFLRVHAQNPERAEAAE
ncbi:MAG: methyltransferase domain-containing protein [Alphaproteobacteria bacterium]